MTADHHADLLVTNARIWTGDRRQPEAEALAVRAGRIVALSTNAHLSATRASHTRVLDAGGVS